MKTNFIPQIAEASLYVLQNPRGFFRLPFPSVNSFIHTYISKRQNDGRGRPRHLSLIRLMPGLHSSWTEKTHYTHPIAQTVTSMPFQNLLGLSSDANCLRGRTPCGCGRRRLPSFYYYSCTALGSNSSLMLFDIMIPKVIVRICYYL